MSDRQGIEIDYCPKCRGVWLDRGELDKIIERNAQYHAAAPQEGGISRAAQSTPFLPAAQPPDYVPPPPGWGQGYGDANYGGHDGHGGGHGNSDGANNSFLGRIFR